MRRAPVNNWFVPFFASLPGHLQLNPAHMASRGHYATDLTPLDRVSPIEPNVKQRGAFRESLRRGFPQTKRILNRVGGWVPPRLAVAPNEANPRFVHQGSDGLRSGSWRRVKKRKPFAGRLKRVAQSKQTHAPSGAIPVG